MTWQLESCLPNCSVTSLSSTHLTAVSLATAEKLRIYLLWAVRVVVQFCPASASTFVNQLQKGLSLAADIRQWLAAVEGGKERPSIECLIDVVDIVSYVIQSVRYVM